MKATARLSVKLWIDCPHCYEQMDIFDHASLNEESEQWDLIATFGRGDTWQNIAKEIICETCKQKFIWDELEY